MTQFAVDLRRRVPGPRRKVYEAFLDPELLPRWMVPPEVAVTAAHVDPRVGGRHIVEMLAADGSRHAFENVIRELVPFERIVLDFSFVGPAGPELPVESVFTVTFTDAGPGATEVHLVHERITHTPPIDHQSVTFGWTHVLDHLEAFFERSPTP